MKKLAVVLGLAGAVVVPALLAGHNAYALDAKGVAARARDILGRARIVHSEAVAEMAEARKSDELADRAWRQARITSDNAHYIALDAASILGDDKEHRAVIACARAHQFFFKASQLDARAYRIGADARHAQNEEAAIRKQIANVQDQLRDPSLDPVVKKNLQDALKDLEAAAARELRDYNRDVAQEKALLADARADTNEADRLKKIANELVPNSCK